MVHTNSSWQHPPKIGNVFLREVGFKKKKKKWVSVIVGKLFNLCALTSLPIKIEVIIVPIT